jgi:hypothetical protein
MLQRYAFMKIRLQQYARLAAFVSLSACMPEPIIEPTERVSEFFLDNQTSRALRVEMTHRGQPEEIEHSEPIVGGTVSRFFITASIGPNPWPEGVFSSLRVLDASSMATVATQIPTNDDVWALERVPVTREDLFRFTWKLDDASLLPK